MSVRHSYTQMWLPGVPVMFAGGPVWATAWAPVPNSETKQFLALATLPQTELLHQVSSVYSYHSLIQIWAFDKLPNIQLVFVYHHL